MSCNACLGKFTNCIVIPQRYLVAILTMMAIMTAYTTRTTLNIAITEMVIKKNETITNPDACPLKEEHHSYVAIRDPDILYDWSESIQGLLLSSFFWGYLISHVPGGMLAEKIGGKQVMGISLLINNVFTTISPLLIVWSNGNYIVVTVTRIILGFGQGVVYPAMAALMAQWAPPHERSFLSSIAFSGQLLGSVLGTALGGFLIYQVHNWNIIFIFFGALGLIWNVGWQFFCYSYPATNPCLKEKEKLYLEEHLGAR